MSEEIVKIAKFDPEIKQPQIVHETILGASDVNIQPFNSSSSSVDSIVWSLQVPTDKSITSPRFVYEIETGIIRINVFRLNGDTSLDNNSLIRVGRDLSLKPHAFMHILRKANIQFNNQSISTDLSSYFNEILMLLESDSYMTDYGTAATLGIRKTVLHDPDEVVGGEMAGIYNRSTNLCNGTYGDIIFTDVNGNVQANPPNVSDQTDGNQDVFVKLILRGELMFPPLKFNRLSKMRSGFYGIQTINITTTNKTDPSEFFYYGRSTKRQFSTANNNAANAFSWVDQNDAYRSAKLQMKYKSPSLYKGGAPITDNIIPYYDFLRYGLPLSENLGQNTEYSKDTRTVTLSSIPEYILIWVKPSSRSYSNTGFEKYDNDYRFPITKLSLIFGNRSGLFSTYSTQDLYNMSYKNGLKLTYSEWIGNAYSGGKNVSNQIQTIGGFIVIRPGIDIPLDVGMVPNVQSNITMQANVTFKTPKNWLQDVTGKGAAKNVAVNKSYTIEIVSLEKAFMKSLNGSTSLMKRIMRSEEVLSMVPNQPTYLTGSEMIGSGIFDRIKNISQDVSKYYEKIPKPIRELGEDYAKDYIKKKATGGMRFDFGIGTGRYPAISGGRRTKKTRKVNLSDI